MSGLIIDYFAGGGGASEALEIAYGRKVDIAINHDARALAMHAANHPDTLHIQDDVFAVDIAKVCAGRPIDVAWFSPDCTHHSRAKGGRPRSNKRRGLAWVVLRVAALPTWQRPRVIHLENVPEFADWGPLTKEGFPDKSKKGATFRLWVSHLEALGYAVEWKRLKACDYGAPTIRDRLFLTARCDGAPIVWPEPTHYDPKKSPAPKVRLRMQPYRTAAEIIDWSLPCPSIFERKRPLKPNTLRRIARGVMRYVVDNPAPFIVPLCSSSSAQCASDDARACGRPVGLASRAGRAFGEGGPDREGDQLETIAVVAPILAGCGGRAAQSPEYAADRPMNTITAKADQMLVTPTLVHTAHGERDKNGKKRGRGEVDIAEPLGSVTTSQNHALVAPLLVVNRNSGKPWQPADEPAMTVTASGAHLNLVSAFLAQFNNDRGVEPNKGRGLDAPLSTVATKGPHQAICAAHLLNLKGSDRRDGPADAPAPTVCAGGMHIAEVRAFLMKYYGTDQDPRLEEPLHTVTTKDRFGVVAVEIAGPSPNGEIIKTTYVIADIGMRMLSPRELFRAQGFRDDYIIDLECAGRRLSKADQIEKAGNSVSPPPAIALAVANAPLMARVPTAAECNPRKARRAS